jgi:MSHA biogenesis protein MshK
MKLHPIRALVVGVALLQGTAFAQSFTDPTRPPANLLTPEVASANGSTSLSGPRLQAVVTANGRKPRALINGEWVEQGGKYGAFRVHKVTTEWVILKGGDGQEIVRLTPEATVRHAPVMPAPVTIERTVPEKSKNVKKLPAKAAPAKPAEKPGESPSGGAA